MLSEVLKHTVVVGAAGKMGSGISLLMLQELARQDLQASGKIGSGTYRLTLIDHSKEALSGLKEYLANQLVKAGEKGYSQWKTLLGDAEAPSDPQAFGPWFSKQAMQLATFTTKQSDAAGATLVCEAIIEELETKVDLLKNLKEICAPNAYYLTNTSSIPISVLDEFAQLDHRIIGFHFYNPPAVQRLLEIISNSDTSPELYELSNELATNLDKVCVHANDIAGFIGNGHFVRDIMYACSQTEKLLNGHSIPEAVYLVNRISQEFMLRPMGIYQLVDYVGIDVCQKILAVMSKYIPDQNFRCPLVNEMMDHGIRGGQNPDGSQKNGIFCYEHGMPIGVFNPKTGAYDLLAEGSWKAECDQELGELPKGHQSWKQFLKSKNRDVELKDYFDNLFHSNEFGAKLAQQYLKKSRSIAENLVNDGVARNVEDVNTVLTNGFYHLYGAVNPYY